MTKIFKNLLAALFLSMVLIQCGSQEDACNGDKIADCVCDASYVPVCGCDEVTYSNACVAKCEGVKEFKNGPCTVQSNSIIGDWDFMGYTSTDALDLTNPVKTHIYDVNINFDDESAGSNFFKLSGRSAVNIFSGLYSKSGNKIVIKDLEITEIAGTVEANAFENLYLKWILGDLIYTIINKNILQITSVSNGKTETLVFKKK